MMKSSAHHDQSAKDDNETAFEMEGSGVWD